MPLLPLTTLSARDVTSWVWLEAASLQGGEGVAAQFGVRFLGRIPLDPRLSIACERGVTFLASWLLLHKPEQPLLAGSDAVHAGCAMQESINEQQADSPAAKALAEIVQVIRDELKTGV